MTAAHKEGEAKKGYESLRLRLTAARPATDVKKNVRR